MNQDETSKFIDLYFDEVLRPILPNVKKGGHSSWGNADGSNQSVQMDLLGLAETYNQSIYCYSGPLTFIHYTSIDSIINILNTGSIRLYDLNNMTDPNEMNYAFNHIAEEINHDKVKNLKSQIFSFSFCKYNATDLLDDFEMWRLYGLDGNGIGLVFSIDQNNRDTWHHCILSEILYGENKKKSLLEFRERDKAFKEKYKNDITLENTHELALAMASLHKDDIFINEKEVRLLWTTKANNKIWHDHDTDYDIYETLNKDGDKTHYFNLKLYSPNLFQELRKKEAESSEYPQAFAKFTKLHRPKIQIDKIILGYRIKNENLFKVSELLKALAIKRYGAFIPIESSSLIKKF
ncbi:MAG: DUF2971 domain-containing protein [Sphingobacteriaceae bacterium]|nr:DUF2971 domain-containing protein [Sphingobacteriaceae bacterium]